MKVAIVLDTSGSMGRVDLFSLGHILKEIRYVPQATAPSLEELGELTKEYDLILFVTDGYFDPAWILMLDNKIQLIKIDS